MKLNQKLIEQLRNGEIAVKNDGTIEELEHVLNEAFPDDDDAIGGAHSCYFLYLENDILWDCGDNTNLPSKSVKDFFVEEEEFKWGDEVEVWVDSEWWPDYIYISKDPRSDKHIILLKNIDCFQCIFIEDIRKPSSKIELTRQEIAEKFGIKVKQLIIKD